MIDTERPAVRLRAGAHHALPDREDQAVSSRSRRAWFILPPVIVLLAIVQSAAGLLDPGLYRDNAFVKSAWYGNDLVTLVVAVPVMVASLLLAARGSRRAELVLFGMLDYMLYNAAFYLFGSAFNRFFLVYVAMFALSLLALLFGLASYDVDGAGRRFRHGRYARWIAGYLIFVAFGLSGVYVAQSIAFIASGTLPPIVAQSGHPTSIVFALDLTLLVPYLLIGGVWLWKRRAWGYLIATILTVKGVVYTLVLCIGSLFAARAGFTEALSEVPLWTFLTVAGAASSMVLLWNLRTSNTPRTAR